MTSETKPAPERCAHCGVEIGPDVTGAQLICYGCGPVEMMPPEKRTDEAWERQWRRRSGLL